MDIHEKVSEWETKIGAMLFAQANIPESAIAIDFGCGYGQYSVAISQHLKNGAVYSIDKDKKALTALKKKIDDYSLHNITVVPNKGELSIAFGDCFADVVLLFDVIHWNDIKTKMPIRFKLLEEARRVLKANGRLFIAPFKECNRMRDKAGNLQKYTKEQFISEIADCGFNWLSEMDGAVHFEMYYSAYQWKKHNGDLQFGDMETGPVWIFTK